MNNINGLYLYLSSDIGGYTILCGEMLQFAHEVSTFRSLLAVNFVSDLITLRPILSPKSEYSKSNTA